jgi:hypothetical protein
VQLGGDDLGVAARFQWWRSLSRKAVASHISGRHDRPVPVGVVLTVAGGEVDVAAAAVCDWRAPVVQQERRWSACCGPMCIGWFNHIPFPPLEPFSQLPWRRALVEGLLGADFLGFQRTADAEEFLRVRRPGGFAVNTGKVLRGSAAAPGCDLSGGSVHSKVAIRTQGLLRFVWLSRVHRLLGRFR